MNYQAENEDKWAFFEMQRTTVILVHTCLHIVLVNFAAQFIPVLSISVSGDGTQMHQIKEKSNKSNQYIDFNHIPTIQMEAEIPAEMDTRDILH